MLSSAVDTEKLVTLCISQLRSHDKKLLNFSVNTCVCSYLHSEGCVKAKFSSFVTEPKREGNLFIVKYKRFRLLLRQF